MRGLPATGAVFLRRKMERLLPLATLWINLTEDDQPSWILARGNPAKTIDPRAAPPAFQRWHDRGHDRRPAPGAVRRSRRGRRACLRRPGRATRAGGPPPLPVHPP